MMTCGFLAVSALLLNVVSARHVPVIEGILAGVAGLVPRSPTVWSPLPLDLNITLGLNFFTARAPDLTSNATVGTLRYVENSGVCETTPGVYQASGYGEIATNQSVFFWYFGARGGEEGKPLTVWLNGGPGSSSMLGLFQELGPCRVTPDGASYTYNPYSWSNYSNMLFIDQPIGVGFSYGETIVNSSMAAAEDLWTFTQIFLSDPKFTRLANTSFNIWTESYGGHYGPAFAYHILQQNAAITAGELKGIKLNLTTLGIGNGLTNPLVQYPQYPVYAQSNPYNVTLANSTVLSNATYNLREPGGCLDQISSCYATQDATGVGNGVACSEAQQFCNEFVLTPLIGKYDEYDIREMEPDPYPPNLTRLLHNATLLNAIGVPSSVNWTQTSDAVYNNFANAGDWMTNAAPYLEAVVNSGVRTTLYAGDADYICNTKGFEAVADALVTLWSGVYANQTFTNWTVAGHPAGQYKNAGPFSYVRVAGAGHEVAAYGINGSLAEGQAALVFFEQTMKGLPISNT